MRLEVREFEAMRNLTLLLVVLALYGLMLIFGANVLASPTYSAAVLDCGEDHEDDDAGRVLDCGEDHDDDDAGRVLDCGEDHDDDDAGRILDCGEDHDEDDAS